MRQFFIKSVFLLVFVLAITACTSSAGPEPATPTPSSIPTPEIVTITWGFWGDPWEVAINEKVIEVFEADNPHIQVETFHRPWNDYFKELRPKLTAGEPVPDVLFWTQAPIDIPHGYFLDLTPLMAAENYSLADFFTGHRLLIDLRPAPRPWLLERPYR